MAQLLERDSIILKKSDGKDGQRDVIALAFELQSPLLHRLLGRMNVYGLVRTIRIMGATGPSQKKPVVELAERVAKFVTNHDNQLAEWTVDYARVIKLIIAEESEGANGPVIYLNSRHSFVRRLDGRQSSTCHALAVSEESFLARK